LVRVLAQLDLDLARYPIVLAHLQRDYIPRLEPGDEIRQVMFVVKGLVIQCNDHVPHLQAGPVGRTSLDHLDDQNTRAPMQALVTLAPKGRPTGHGRPDSNGRPDTLGSPELYARPGQPGQPCTRACQAKSDTRP
jgi:hypothetical protein